MARSFFGNRICFVGLHYSSGMPAADHGDDQSAVGRDYSGYCFLRFCDSSPSNQCETAFKRPRAQSSLAFPQKVAPFLNPSIYFIQII